MPRVQTPLAHTSACASQDFKAMAEHTVQVNKHSSPVNSLLITIRMLECRDEFDIYHYQPIQLSNKKFIYGLVGGTLYNWLYEQSNSTASTAPFLLHFFDFTLQDYNVKLANLKLKQTKTNFFTRILQENKDYTSFGKFCVAEQTR